MKNKFKFHCILFVAAVILTFLLSITEASTFFFLVKDGNPAEGIEPAETFSPSPWSFSYQACLWITNICFISFIVFFVKLFNLARRGDVFNKKVSSYTKYIGILWCGVVATQQIFNLLFYPSWKIQSLFDNMSHALIFVAGLFIISEIFRIARVMKEEQDLTI